MADSAQTQMKMLKLMLALRAGRGMWRVLVLIVGFGLANGLSAPLARAEDSEALDPKHIAFYTAEFATIYGNGGLGVMSEASTRALEEEYRTSGVPTQVTVVMPYYMRFYQDAKLRDSLQDEGLEVRVGLDYRQSTHAHRWETFRAYSKWHGRVKVIFLRHMNRDGEPNYFDNKLVDGVGPQYGPAGLEWEAFAVFGKAAATFTYQHLPTVDLAMFNDWHTATGAYFLRHPDYIGFGGRTAVHSFGIAHNYAHQGKYHSRMVDYIGLDWRDSNSYLHYGEINDLKMLLMNTGLPETVSETHAGETLTDRFAFTLEGVTNHVAQQYRYTGILNGIDDQLWDVERIALQVLPTLKPDVGEDVRHYLFDEDNLGDQQRGTRLLQDLFGLNPDPQAFIAVSTARPDPQKGFEFLPGVLEYIMDRNPHFQVIFVGDPAPGTENEEWRKRFEDFVKNPAYEGRVVKKKFASSLEYVALTWGTLNLAFSTFEPAGQTVQMSSNVGTVSAGTRGGGVAESIRTEWAIRNGFLAQLVYEADGKTVNARETGKNVIATLEEAVRVFYEDPAEWTRMQVNAFRSKIIWKKQIKPYRLAFRYLLQNGPEKLLHAYGPAPHGRIYTPTELMSMLEAVQRDCGGLYGGAVSEETKKLGTGPFR